MSKPSPPKAVVADRDASAEFTLEPAVMDALLKDVQARRSKGLFVWLAELPRSVRALALGSIFLAASIGLVVGYGVRGDLANQSWIPLGVLLGLTALCGARLVTLALRGVEDVPLSASHRRLAILCAILPPVLAVVCGLTMSGVLEPELVVYTTESCFGFGAGVGLALAGTARLFQRDTGWTWRRLVLAGASGASVALLVLGSHCPDNDWRHLALGHAGGYAFVLLLMWAVASILERRTGKMPRAW